MGLTALEDGDKSTCDFSLLTIKRSLTLQHKKDRET